MNSEVYSNGAATFQRWIGMQPTELGDGPTGLALDEAGARLYVWNRFSSALSVLRLHPGRSISNSVSAADADAPLQAVTLDLGGNVPPGATFNPATGLFNWISVTSVPPACYSFYVRAMDNGLPPLSDTRWMTVKCCAAANPPAPARPRALQQFLGHDLFRRRAREPIPTGDQNVPE